MAVHFRLEFIQLIALDTVGKSNRIHEATETPKRLDCLAVVASLNYSNADLTSHNRQIVATIEDDVRNLISAPRPVQEEAKNRWNAGRHFREVAPICGKGRAFKLTFGGMLARILIVTEVPEVKIDPITWQAFQRAFCSNDGKNPAHSA
ncbi:MAG: hypothetical protein ACLQLG_01075 [Thermoguttaceae bacterium]